MEGVTLWEGSACPLCESHGINSELTFFRLNLHVAALLCKRKKCPFPLTTDYPDTFVRVHRGGKIILGSQFEIGPQEHKEEDDSDNSPYISDASEESVTFPDFFPEFKKDHDGLSQNTDGAKGLEVDAFDISSIDFETDDSMDTFKLRNEITSLEMEIAKNVENMNSAPSHTTSKDSSVLDGNNKNLQTSGSVAAKSSKSSLGNVCADTHKELNLTDSSCVEMNENGIDNISSGHKISYRHSSPTDTLESSELIKISEELANCMQYSEVKIPVSDKPVSNHKHVDIQHNSNSSCHGGSSGVNGNSNDETDHCHDINGGGVDVNGGSIVDSRSSSYSDNNSGDVDGGNTISNSSCSGDNMEKQIVSLTTIDTSDPESESLVLIPQDTKNTVENNVSKNCQLLTELFTSDLETFKEKCDDTEIEIIFDEHENNDTYEIVEIDCDTSTGIPESSRDYEVISLELNFCDQQESNKDVAENEIAEVCSIAQNTCEKHGTKSEVAHARSNGITPPVKLKIIEEDGQFVCTTNDLSSSVTEVEEKKLHQNNNSRNSVHSENCICFLCTEPNNKGITKHLDRQLADLFTEEHPAGKCVTERELRTEKELMKDFVHYMTGNTNQNTKKRRTRKRKRLFHL